ncbi:zinc ribbon domain-containing protein [candidate division KSB1 bacterium]|nr:zinc ribbon domain-containing protein [candidate division KSB1 bacterium]
MPIYEYRCTNCGHVFEKLQSIGADNSLLECPECHTPKPNRIFSAFAAKSSGLTTSGSSGSSGNCGGGRFT